MKIAVVSFIVGLVLLGYFVSFLIATAPHDPAVWHNDPLEIVTSDTPNAFRMAPENSTKERIDAVAPIYSEPAAVIAEAFDEFVLRQRATVRIAGLPQEGLVTYVQRSEKLKIPDYISVKFIDLEGGNSTIAIYSRSRYGYADLGVNQARVKRWVETLKSFELSGGN